LQKLQEQERLRDLEEAAQKAREEEAQLQRLERVREALEAVRRARLQAEAAKTWSTATPKRSRRENEIEAERLLKQLEAEAERERRAEIWRSSGAQSHGDTMGETDTKTAGTAHCLPLCEHEFFAMVKGKKKNRFKAACGHCGDANAKAMHICLHCQELRCISCKQLP
jgi:DNA mismatch repair ATPase MutS